jgi:hypothetical protein
MTGILQHLRFRLLKRSTYRPVLYLILAIIACGLVAFPAAAQEILQTTFDSMKETQAWWDQLWKDTFDPTNLSSNVSMYTFATAVRFILAIGIIFWLFQYGQKMAESRGMAQYIGINTQFLVPVVLVAIFLSGQGFYSRLLAYGMRDIVNSWSNGAMEMQIAGHQLRTALADQLVTQDAKDEITRQGQMCMQMPQPAVSLSSPTRPPLDPNNPLTDQQRQAYDYLECIQKLEQLAERKQQEALNKTCSPIPGVRGTCDFLLKYTRKTAVSIREVAVDETLKLTKGKPPNYTRGLADIIGGAIGTAGYSTVLNFTQWLWTSFLELAMWLSALFAPVFIAASIIPGRQNLFTTWLIGFLTIGMAKLAYVFVLGVVAAQLSSQTTLLASDLRFPMALGIFAPAVSLAVVTGGGLAAAMSFRSQSTAVVGAAAGVVTSAVATVGYSMTRYADRRR